MDVKQVVMVMFNQIESYGRNNSLVKYSIILNFDDHDQIKLTFKHDDKPEQDNTVFSMIRKSAMIYTGELDSLKAIREIGNMYIRNHNEQVNQHFANLKQKNK